MKRSRTESPKKLPTYDVMGDNLKIYFDEEFKNTTDPEGDEAGSYTYLSAKTKVVARRDDIIEAVMRCKYGTFGSEIAAIQNGGNDQAEHQALRTLAKELADGWLNRENP